MCKYLILSLHDVLEQINEIALTQPLDPNRLIILATNGWEIQASGIYDWEFELAEIITEDAAHIRPDELNVKMHSGRIMRSYDLLGLLSNTILTHVRQVKNILSPILEDSIDIENTRRMGYLLDYTIRNGHLIITAVK